MLKRSGAYADTLFEDKNANYLQVQYIYTKLKEKSKNFHYTKAPYKRWRCVRNQLKTLEVIVQSPQTYLKVLITISWFWSLSCHSAINFYTSTHLYYYDKTSCMYLFKQVVLMMGIASTHYSNVKSDVWSVHVAIGPTWGGHLDKNIWILLTSAQALHVRYGKCSKNR